MSVRVTAAGHPALMPPSTTRLCPVTSRDASLARNSTAWAMSSAWRTCGSGCHRGRTAAIAVLGRRVRFVIRHARALAKDAGDDRPRRDSVQADAKLAELDSGAAREVDRGGLGRREFAKRAAGAGEKLTTNGRDAAENATATIEEAAVRSVREFGKISRAVQTTLYQDAEALGRRRGGTRKGDCGLRRKVETWFVSTVKRSPGEPHFAVPL